MINQPPPAARALNRAAFNTKLRAFFLASAAACAVASLDAQTTPTDSSAAESEAGKLPASDDVLKMSEFVVTATSRPGQTKMESSVSVSSYPIEQIQISAPRSTAELFRAIPGIRAESSSGDGNTNITVRGLPLSAGGSKYLLLEEDGLPILEFGDINFGTAEQWLRADASLANLESVRGGGASTGVSNSPGGVINFISKTGDHAGGTLQYSKGIEGLDQDRIDLGYGSPVGKDMSFFLGGFYRIGEGFKTTKFTANNGGQIKLNITKRFENGYIRIYLKGLDDRSQTFMPIPVAISGSLSSPTYSSIPGFDLLRGTLNTPQLTAYKTVTSEGTFRGDVTDGLHTISHAIGAEVHFDLPGGFALVDRFRAEANSGDFFAPYPAGVGTAANFVTTIGGIGATAKYATGPFAGQNVDLANVGGNGTLTDVHFFNTKLNNMNDTNNDLKLSRPFDLANGIKIDVDLGFYRAQQTIDQSWLWNSYLQTTQGKNSSLIDVYSASGTLLTNGGLIAYGVGADPINNWGAGNNRNVDLVYNINAPYLSLGAKIKNLSLDGSVRRDLGQARGGITSATGYTAGIPTFGSTQIYDYNWAATSWSFGANYELTKSLAFFGRVSLGNRANADRFSTLRTDGTVPSPLSPVDEVKSQELGAKYRLKTAIPGELQLFGTFFNTKTSDQNYDITQPQLGVTGNHYKAKGLELEVGYNYSGFDLRSGVTYTDAKIDSSNDPTIVGNRPQRQGKWMYSFAPSYTIKGLTVGASLIGVSDSYADNTDGLIMPGYNYVKAYVGYTIAKGLRVSLSMNNIGNVVGITEVDNGANQNKATKMVSGLGTARSIPGRSTVVTIDYEF